MADNLHRSVHHRPQSFVKSTICFGLTAATLALVAVALQWVLRAVPGFLS